MTDLRLLDLFSGIGGFSYAAEHLVGGYKTVGFCEIDPFCREVLSKHWPDVEVFEDVRRTDDFVRCGRVDIITGGYPCQPFSLAGKQKGVKDDRHLWPSMFELIKQKRPAYVIGENVAGHIALGLDEVLFDLESEGYTARPFVIPACAVDAPHRRDRVWVVAHADQDGEPISAVDEEQGCWELGAEDMGHPRSGGQQGDDRWRSRQEPPHGRPNVADTNREGLEGAEWQGFEGRGKRPSIRSWWEPEPGVRRVANGVSRRVDRLKSLGNSIVPQVAAQILSAIREAHDATP